VSEVGRKGTVIAGVLLLLAGVAVWGPTVYCRLTGALAMTYASHRWGLAVSVEDGRFSLERYTPECLVLSAGLPAVPIWIPSLVLLGLGGLLLRSKRARPGLHHCRCGYDLIGNASGRCPECGRATQSEKVGKWEGGKG